MTEGSFRQRNKIQPTGKLSQVFAEITAPAPAPLPTAIEAIWTVGRRVGFARAVATVEPRYKELLKLEAQLHAEQLAEQERQTALNNAVLRAREAVLRK